MWSATTGDRPLRFVQMWLAPTELRRGAVVRGGARHRRRHPLRGPAGRRHAASCAAWPTASAPRSRTPHGRMCTWCAGAVRLGGQELRAGDAARITDGAGLELTGLAASECLVWEMAAEPRLRMRRARGPRTGPVPARGAVRGPSGRPGQLGQHRVGQLAARPRSPTGRRPGRSAPHRRARASGSTHRNVPDCPKCPNVRGEDERPGPVRRLAVADLEAQPPVVGLLMAVARQHTRQTGEDHPRRRRERLGREQPRAPAARPRSGPGRRPWRRRPWRGSRPARSRTCPAVRAPPRADTAGRGCRSPWLCGRPALRNRRWSRSCGCPARPSHAARRRPARRCARADGGPWSPRVRPVRPARSRPPRRPAARRTRPAAWSPTRAGTAAPGGPYESGHHPSARTTAAAAVGTGQFSIIRRLCMPPSLTRPKFRSSLPVIRACLECTPSL